MFRRRWSGLPDDPDFPVDLEKLGYYIQPETDEIRSITNPNTYFNFFINKNMRYNERQRFAFNLAVEDIIHIRLASLGLTKLPLPLPLPLIPTTITSVTNIPTTLDNRHVPIFVSENLYQADRIVVLFGEGDQDLGVIAHRVIGGRGGVDEGSVVSIVKALVGEDGNHGVGVVLANTGERWWWPEGKRALSHRSSMGVKMKSCVHKGRWFDPAVNEIPGSEHVDAHVKTVFESVLDNSTFVGETTTIQVIGITDGAVAVEKYLDANWDRWEGRIGCLAMLGGGQDVDGLKNEGFKKFLREKSRIYITAQVPLETPISHSEGNPNTIHFTSYGCPVLSSGEPYYTELTLIKAKSAVLSFLDEVYKTKKGSYANPTFQITYADENSHPEESPAWGNDTDLTGPGAADFVPRPAIFGPRNAELNRGQMKASRESDEGGLEVISREEWERRMEDLGEEGMDPSKVLVM